MNHRFLATAVSVSLSVIGHCSAGRRRFAAFRWQGRQRVAVWSRAASTSATPRRWLSSTTPRPSPTGLDVQPCGLRPDRTGRHLRQLHRVLSDRPGAPLVRDDGQQRLDRPGHRGHHRWHRIRNLRWAGGRWPSVALGLRVAVRFHADSVRRYDAANHPESGRLPDQGRRIAVLRQRRLRCRLRRERSLGDDRLIDDRWNSPGATQFAADRPGPVRLAGDADAASPTDDHGSAASSGTALNRSPAISGKASVLRQDRRVVSSAIASLASRKPSPSSARGCCKITGRRCRRPWAPCAACGAGGPVAQAAAAVARARWAPA